MRPPRALANAFTLVELLVVVAIIALLIGVLAPALGSARSGASGAVCSSNLRQCFTACQLFASEHDGLGPAIGQPYAAVPNWALVVQQQSGVAATGGAAYRERSALACPAASFTLNAQMTRTYAMTATGHNKQAWNADPDWYDDALPPGATHVGVRLNLVAQPSRSPLLIDSARNDQPQPLPPDRCASMLDFRPEAAMADRIGRFHAVATRSSAAKSVMGFNAVMLDGSVSLFADPAESWLDPLP